MLTFLTTVFLRKLLTAWNSYYRNLNTIAVMVFKVTLMFSLCSLAQWLRKLNFKAVAQVQILALPTKCSCYIAGNVFPNSARSRWLLRGHMASNIETVSRRNL